MSLLSYNIIIFRLVGLWYPSDRVFGWKSIFYALYTAILVFSLYTFTLSQVIKMCGSIHDPNEFSNASFMSVTMVKFTI